MLIYTQRHSIDHSRKYHNIYHNALRFTPKFCICIVFSFSWELTSSPKKLKTMLMQNFGALWCVMVFSGVVNSQAVISPLSSQDRNQASIFQFSESASKQQRRYRTYRTCMRLGEMFIGRERRETTDEAQYKKQQHRLQQQNFFRGNGLTSPSLGERIKFTDSKILCKPKSQSASSSIVAKKADATLKKLKLKIRPSQLDGFENYPELPESIETFSPES